MGEQIDVDQLFHKTWLKPFGLGTLLLILYIPLGICLFIIRVFILLQFILLGYILPPSKFRQKCLKVMSSVLGVSCSTEGDLNQGTAKIFVANHITNFDHFPIHLTTNAAHPLKRELSGFIAKPLGIFGKALEELSKEQIESLEDPLIVFPEGDTTNGEVGVLSFTSLEIPPGIVVQPVAIKVSRFLLNSSFIGSTWLQEAFITMFCPNTHFTLTFLAQEIVDTEGIWKRSTQSSIAQSLGIATTKFNSSDKAEYVKRLYFRPPSIATMTREVQKQLLPQNISPELIISTLQSTGSVEATLEVLRKSCVTGGINPPPSTFSKSATQRMMTFQERKRIMIATARQKYVEKHNLDVTL